MGIIPRSKQTRDACLCSLLETVESEYCKPLWWFSINRKMSTLCLAVASPPCVPGVWGHHGGGLTKGNNIQDMSDYIHVKQIVLVELFCCHTDHSNNTPESLWWTWSSSTLLNFSFPLTLWSTFSLDRALILDNSAKKWINSVQSQCF